MRPLCEGREFKDLADENLRTLAALLPRNVLRYAAAV